ncbi:hypothetical protein PISMIDRAFT_103961, partial [Pisolithus microcarpus 441]
LKEKAPASFPTNRTYTYSSNTSNYGLHIHIENFHLLEFLEQAEKQGWRWRIYINSINMAFSMGYTFTTLRQALQNPGVSIRKLPPPPQPLGDRLPKFPSSKSSLSNGLPEFSPSTFHCYLVRFILSNDQVCDLPSMH